MFKLVGLFAILITIQAFNAELIFHKPTFLDKQHLFNHVRDDMQIEHTNVKYAGSIDFPADQGGNWGDLIMSKRVQGSQLIVRDLIINEDIFDKDTEFKYNNQIDGMNVTSVRAINLGRQRALVALIVSSDQGFVFVDGFIKHGEQMRLLIEAYGVPVNN